MELFTIFYWITFYAGMLGWHNGSIDKLSSTDMLMFKKSLTPNILLLQSLSSYVYMMLAFGFGFLYDHNWLVIIPIVGTLLGIEYLYLQTEDIRSKIKKTITFKFFAILVGVIITAYSSVESGTYLERLTETHPSAFSSFDFLLTFLLSAICWAIIIQGVLIITVVIYLFKLMYSNKKLTENLLFVLTGSLSISFVLVLFFRGMFEVFIPYMVDDYFIEFVYHENTNLYGDTICTNLNQTDKLVLLPSGEASIVIDEEKLIFDVVQCVRDSLSP